MKNVLRAGLSFSKHLYAGIWKDGYVYCSDVHTHLEELAPQAI